MNAKFEAVNRSGKLPPIKKLGEFRMDEKYTVVSIKKTPTPFGERIVVNLKDGDVIIATFLPIRMNATIDADTLTLFDTLASQDCLYMIVSGIHKSKEIKFGSYDE